MPEALSPNDIVLPKGAECDKCNQYFGNKLEPMLYRYPGIALALQLWGIRGKKGRHRKQLGNVVRTAAGDIKFGGDLHKIEKDVFGRRTIYLDLPPDPNFHMLDFRRALYRIALSTVALLESEQYALDSKFDGQGATSVTRGRERRRRSLKGRPRSAPCPALRSFATLRRASERSSFFSS